MMKWNDLREKHIKCQLCVYFDENTSSCRKNPPVIGSGNSSIWPYVRGEDWCGQFESIHEKLLSLR